MIYDQIYDIKGDKKKPNKSFYKFSIFGPKLILEGKMNFPSLFILWSKVEKRMENMKNDI